MDVETGHSAQNPSMSDMGIYHQSDSVVPLQQIVSGKFQMDYWTRLVF